MMTKPLVKICGITSADDAYDAAMAGADLIGFVFYPKSPRAITPEAANDIVTDIKQAAFEEGFELPKFVGLFVDAGEKLLAESAPFLSYLQFHGHEDPERMAEFGADFGIDTIKALPVATADDLAKAGEFQDAADMLLFDARPPDGAERPGGHGAVFDWSLLGAYNGETPFLLAGGLNPQNVEEAIAALANMPSFAGVDVSSGVEEKPGLKDPDLVAAFVKMAHSKTLSASKESES